jgi:hypothetical protein
VLEFEEIPVICKRELSYSGKLYLKKGGLYTRSYDKPETIIVPSQNEMREILDIAVDKQLIKYFERQRRIGRKLEPTKTPDVSDDEKFKAEIKDLKSNE